MPTVTGPASEALLALLDVVSNPKKAKEAIEKIRAEEATLAATIRVVGHAREIPKLLKAAGKARVEAEKILLDAKVKAEKILENATRDNDELVKTNQQIIERAKKERAAFDKDHKEREASLTQREKASDLKSKKLQNDIENTARMQKSYESAESEYNAALRAMKNAMETSSPSPAEVSA